jgi:hypothetical protein
MLFFKDLMKQLVWFLTWVSLIEDSSLKRFLLALSQVLYLDHRFVKPLEQFKFALLKPKQKSPLLESVRTQRLLLPILFNFKLSLATSLLN